MQSARKSRCLEIGQLESQIEGAGYFKRTFTVIAEAHLGLSKANCVFSRTYAIELLKLGLVDTLYMQISIL